MHPSKSQHGFGAAPSLGGSGPVHPENGRPLAPGPMNKGLGEDGNAGGGWCPGLSGNNQVIVFCVPSHKPCSMLVMTRHACSSIYNAMW